MPTVPQSREVAAEQAKEDGFEPVPRRGCAEMWHHRKTPTGYDLRVWNSLSATTDQRVIPAHGIVTTGLADLMVAEGAPLPGSPADRAGVKARDRIVAIVRDGKEHEIMAHRAKDSVLEHATGVVVLRDTGRTRRVEGGPGREPVYAMLRFKW